MNLELSATALAIYCYLMYIEDRKIMSATQATKPSGKPLK